jgi:hypothetical protein
LPPGITTIKKAEVQHSVAVAKPEPVDEADGDAIVKLTAKTVRSHH